MQYTKDIILDMRYRRKLDYNKIKNFAITTKNLIIKNRLIVITLILLSSLITIDITLVNSFLHILNTVY